MRTECVLAMCEPNVHTDIFNILRTRSILSLESLSLFFYTYSNVGQPLALPTNASLIISLGYLQYLSIE